MTFDGSCTSWAVHLHYCYFEGPIHIDVLSVRKLRRSRSNFSYKHSPFPRQRCLLREPNKVHKPLTSYVRNIAMVRHSWPFFCPFLSFARLSVHFYVGFLDGTKLPINVRRYVHPDYRASTVTISNGSKIRVYSRRHGRTISKISVFFFTP